MKRPTASEQSFIALADHINTGMEIGLSRVGMSVVRCPDNLAETPAFFSDHGLDWLLVSLSAGEDYAAELLAQTRQSAPHVRTALVRQENEPPNLLASWLEHGVRVIAMNNTSPARLSQLMSTSDRLNVAVVEQPNHLAKPFIPRVALTNREIQVLDLIRRGFSNTEISRKLTISLNTVQFHVSNVLRKVGARNRAEATAKAPLYTI